MSDEKKNLNPLILEPLFWSEHTLPSLETETLAFWERENIFEKTLQKPAPRGSFVFFEGPPTANGRPGIHHAESRAFKDCIPRFRTMQGYRVERKAGWDTHGLPVELEVEKQLGFTGKKDIESYGIEAFNAKCRENVWTYLQDWQTFTKRLGFWVDMEHPYVTYHPEYVESLWSVVKQMWDRELLYKDYRVTPHCPRCGTSLSSHELAQGYQDVKDISVTAEFVVTESSQESLRSGVRTVLLAWTTTPWTLPGNIALAVGPDLTYVVIEKKDEADGTPVRFILAKALLEKIFPESTYTIVSELKGSELVGTRYEPLYPFMEASVTGENKEKLIAAAYRVHPASFVTTEDGTGIVHTAVMYGADDFDLGNQVGLPKQHIVNLDGTFLDGMDFLSGRFVADEDVAVDIIKDLAHRGLLFAKAKYEHSYPHCWRCKTKVIYYAKDSWYVRMSSLRSELLAANASIHWEPAHIQDGRFGEWLRDVKDWAFSRERYWGTPLPIWESADGDRICIGSFEELHALAKDKSLVGDQFDPHRPFVDDVILVKDGKEYKRVPDVCDVWFDSGAMPYAQWHYPFENKELVDSGAAYPADYISEAIDQTRGWFYTLLAVSVALGRVAPYKNVICLGHVLDAEGKKMSKSLGNIVKPMEMIEKYGADAVRWYMYTINQPGESKRFDEKTLSDMVRKNFTILKNVASFYQMVSGDPALGEYTQNRFAGLSRTHILDRWILARLHKLIQDTTTRLESYIITETVRELGVFIDDLSTWYVRRSRERMKESSPEEAAIVTLRECLQGLSLLMAPFAPFFSDTLYRQVSGKDTSVHLEDWPVVNPSYLDEKLLQDMKRTRDIVSLCLEARAQVSLPVRQPLARVTVTLPEGKLEEDFVALIAEEINVKEVLFQKGDLGIVLDTELTPELKGEGLARELSRVLNDARKKAGLTIQDRVRISLDIPEGEVSAAALAHQELLCTAARADEMLFTKLPEDVVSAEINGVSVRLLLQKV